MIIASVGIVITILISNLLALILPLIINKLGKDSSSVSLPLLTIVVDIITVIIFLGVGILFI
ncbi:magnesium transporter [Vibrio harveyi]|nr:magnesium transporter [Vibrio harveyi]